MFNHVLWTLDNETDGRRFERLCTDLLGRQGYSDIIPIGGPHDRGRDAEIRMQKGFEIAGGVTFFQYSLEERWESKLKRELQKIYTNNHKINSYVFVTSRTVTGAKRDKLTQMIATKYKWQLVIYDREWLRHRLEEVHPDLAEKYLAVRQPLNQVMPREQHLVPLLAISGKEKAWRLYKERDYEAAAIEFKLLLKENDLDAEKWMALASCQYWLRHYTEALGSVNHALSLANDNKHVLSLKASILTEEGILRGLKPHLLLAKQIFKKIAEGSESWLDYYNYGNVLDALGEYELAKQQFLTAISHDPKQPTVWKNLGTTYFHLRDHEEELRCYENALALDERLVEALVSKGVTLFVVYGKAKEAAELITRAITVDYSISVRWPLAWYWLGRVLLEMGDLVEALGNINKGLDIAPHYAGLIDLKSKILSKLWPKDAEYIDQALSFFRFRVDLSSEDFDSFAELLKLYAVKGQNAAVEELLAQYANIGKSKILPLLALSGHTLDECFVSLRYLSAYRKFRNICSVSEYIDLLKQDQIKADDDFDDALFVACSVPFGLACDLLFALPATERPEVLKTLSSMIQNSLSYSFPRLSTKLVGTINLGTNEQIADGFSRIIAIWHLIALLEFSRQFVYLGGFFEIPANKLDGTLEPECLATWQRNIMHDTIHEINKLLKIFKE